MENYRELIKYLDIFTDETFGRWVIDSRGDGTPKNPYHFSHVRYSDAVNDFVRDVHDSADHIGIDDYIEILNKREIEFGIDSMSGADVDELSSVEICALLLAAVRAERFYDGALLSFFENGSIQKWLKELKMRTDQDNT